MALHWKQLWPLFALALTLCVLLLAASWFGLWLAVPIWARIAGVAVTGLALAAIVGAAVLKPRPTWRESLGRLDRNSALAHRPATALSDELAVDGQDARPPGAVGSASRPRPGAGRTAQGRLARAAPCGARSLGAALCRRPDRHCRFFRRGCGVGSALQGRVRLDGSARAGRGVPHRRLDRPAGLHQVTPVLLDLRRRQEGPIPRLRSKCPPSRRWSSGLPMLPGSRSTSPAA